MLAGFFLLAGSILTFICITWLAIKNESMAPIGWIGSLGMILASGVQVAFQSNPYVWVVGAIYLASLALAIFGAYRISGSSSRANEKNANGFRSEAIGGIMQVAATRESLVELLNYSLDRILELFSLNSGAIHIYHPARNVLVMGALRGLSPLHAANLEIVAPGQSAIGRALQNRRVLIIRDLKLSPDFSYFGGKAEGYSFLAVSPIMVNSECWGVITLLGRKSYHRGMIEVSLLEQCGLQLGKALQVGRQNRRLAAAFERQKSIIDYLCANLTKLDNQNYIGQLQGIIDGFPGRLFNGSRMVMISNLEGSWQTLYVHPEIVGGPVQFHFDLALLLSGHDNISSGRMTLRSVSKIEISSNPIGSYFDQPILTAVYFHFDEGDAIALVNLPRETIEKNYAQELSILQMILKLIWMAAGDKRSDGERLSSKREDRINNLESLLSEVKVKLELLKEEFEGRSDETGKQLVSRLASISDEIPGAYELQRQLPVELNTTIGRLIKECRLDAEFQPAPSSLELKLPEPTFSEMMRELFARAFDIGQKITISLTADNGLPSITIAGPIKNDYNIDKVSDWTRRYGVALKVVDSKLKMSDEASAATSKAEEGFGGKALVVESRDIIKGLLVDFLDRLGVEADVVYTAAQALVTIEQNNNKGTPYELAIVDMTLSDMSGITLAKLIKEKYHRMNVVLLASWGAGLSEESLKQSGIDAVLYKPFSLDQLRQVLKSGFRIA